MTVIAGDDGPNVLVDAPGQNNTLRGGLGDDTYSFVANHGFDRIEEVAGSDTIQFDAGIGQSDLRIYRGVGRFGFPAA